MEEIIVSIICCTYNHEKYIKRAIESFLEQKTTFKFEVLIHEDASTDNTADIVRKYEKDYPEIIHVIYAEENRYSKGIRIPEDILIPISNGKYLAFCEGDDYFTDPYKLQKQVDYLEKHPECSLCFHSAEIVTVDEKRMSVIRPESQSCIIDAEKVIKGGGGYMATNSIMFPSRITKNLPSYFSFGRIYDYIWQMYCASQGTTYFIDEIMSAYRKGDPNSWSNTSDYDKNKNIERYIQEQKILDQFDKETNFKFHDAVQYRIRESKFSLFIWSEDKKLKNDKDVISFKKEISKYSYIILLLRARHPALFRTIQNLNTKRKVLLSKIFNRS